MSQEEDDLVAQIAQIERLFRNVDEKLESIRAQKQQHEFDVARVEKSTECVERRIRESLQRQRNELLNRLKVEFIASMTTTSSFHYQLVRFQPGLDCRHILNDTSHLIGSITYSNPFTLLKKLRYYPLLNQFNGEIKLASSMANRGGNIQHQNQPQQQQQQQHSIRIIVLVTIKRLFVYLNQIEDGNSGRMCAYFKMFNFKWDELASIRACSSNSSNSAGNYKNLLAYEENDRNGNKQRIIRIVSLFAESEHGRHWLKVYDEHLTLLANCEFLFNLRLVSLIGGDNLEEIVCWRSDTNRMLVFNFNLELVETVGQENDASGGFYFGDTTSNSTSSSSSSSSSSVNLIDVSPQVLLVYTSDETSQMQRVSIVNRLNGRVQGCIEFGFNSFPSMIKIDSHSNILVRTCDAGLAAPAAVSLIKYFDSRGNLLIQLGGIGVPDPGGARDGGNIINRFDSFNRIDLNRDRDDELVCFCKQDGVILFF